MFCSSPSLVNHFSRVFITKFIVRCVTFAIGEVSLVNIWFTDDLSQYVSLIFI